jgi:hypothetical protein
MKMAVFRVERNTNYTTMSNYHLRDTNLSLKAKGLLSVFLSLPDEWHYSISGLMKITKEGRDCLTAVIKELEKRAILSATRAVMRPARSSGSSTLFMKSRRQSRQDAAGSG